MVVPLTALFTAMGLQWVSWGQGKFNWGPRLGAILLLVFGQVAFAGTLLGGWLTQGVNWFAGYADQGVAYLLGSAAGSAVGYLVHWLPAALLSAFWLAAMMLDRIFSERMTWRLAWVGMLIPTFVAAIPGPAGQFFNWIFGVLASFGSAIVTGLFHVRG